MMVAFNCYTALLQGQYSSCKVFAWSSASLAVSASMLYWLLPGSRVAVLVGLALTTLTAAYTVFECTLMIGGSSRQLATDELVFAVMMLYVDHCRMLWLALKSYIGSTGLKH